MNNTRHLLCIKTSWKHSNFEALPDIASDKPLFHIITPTSQASAKAKPPPSRNMMLHGYFS